MAEALPKLTEIKTDVSKDGLAAKVILVHANGVTWTFAMSVHEIDVVIAALIEAQQKGQKQQLAHSGGIGALTPVPNSSIETATLVSMLASPDGSHAVLQTATDNGRTVNIRIDPEHLEQASRDLSELADQLKDMRGPKQ